MRVVGYSIGTSNVGVLVLTRTSVKEQVPDSAGTGSSFGQHLPTNIYETPRKDPAIGCDYVGKGQGCFSRNLLLAHLNYSRDATSFNEDRMEQRSARV